mmetsp:Transcript_1422/g.4208  ORF Transcript_1422/g.4208 Transcript_1422/m.4208 type:complete len:301 (+) Transcript_1422:1070-1972(+)
MTEAHLAEGAGHFSCDLQRIQTKPSQSLHIRDLDAVDELSGEHALGGQIPAHSRDVDVWAPPKLKCRSCPVPRLSNEVEFTLEGHSKVGKEPKELKVRKEVGNDAEHDANGAQVSIHLAGEVRVLDLDSHLLAVSGHSLVHLRQRRCRDGLSRKLAEVHAWRGAKFPDDGRMHLLIRAIPCLVLQSGQDRRHLLRQNVVHGRDILPELGVDAAMGLAEAEHAVRGAHMCIQQRFLVLGGRLVQPAQIPLVICSNTCARGHGVRETRRGVHCLAKDFADTFIGGDSSDAKGPTAENKTAPH